MTSNEVNTYQQSQTEKLKKKMESFFLAAKFFFGRNRSNIGDTRTQNQSIEAVTEVIAAQEKTKTSTPQNLTTETSDESSLNKTLDKAIAEETQQFPVIESFINLLYNTTIITNEAFEELTAGEKLKYLDELEREGLLLVRENTHDKSPISYGVAEVRTHLRVIFENNDALVDQFFIKVQPNQQIRTGVKRSDWFSPDFVSNPEQVSNTLRTDLEKLWEEKNINTARELFATDYGRRLDTVFRKLVSLGITNYDYLDFSREKLIDLLTNSETLLKLAQVNEKLPQADMFFTAFEDAKKALENRNKNKEQILKIAENIKPLYEALAPLYVDFAEMVLQRLQETGGKMIFLFRDGQFLRKTVNEVRKHRFKTIEQSQLSEGLISRAVLDVVKKSKGHLDEQEISLDSNLGLTAQSNLDQAREVYEEKKHTLEAYLQSIGCYEPFVDFADTGMGGSIASEICNYREEYWNDHATDLNFLQRISVAYEVSLEEIKNNGEKYKKIFSGQDEVPGKGFAVRTYMLITSRTDGDNSTGLVRPDKRGSVYAVVTPQILEDQGYAEGKDGLIRPPYAELTHMVESRLNGYGEAIIELAQVEQQGSVGAEFKTLHGETVQYTNENVSEMSVPRRRKYSRKFGLEITGDYERTALNFASMRYVMAGVRKQLRSRSNPNRDTSNDVRTAMEATLLVGRPLKNILRFKSPRPEDVADYMAMLQTQRRLNSQSLPTS